MKTVSGQQCTGPYLQPSTGPCLPSSPNDWEPPVGEEQPAVYRQEPSLPPAEPQPPKARDGLARCYN